MAQCHLGSFRLLGIGPDLIHSGEGLPWTPQGQGYDEFRDQFLTSYYGEDGVLLSIQDKVSGDEVGNVVREGTDGEKLDHGGGVSTDGTFVHVADGGHVLVDDRAAIDAAAPGQPVAPLVDNPTPGVGSYMKIHDGQASAGQFGLDPQGRRLPVPRQEGLRRPHRPRQSARPLRPLSTKPRRVGSGLHVLATRPRPTCRRRCPPGDEGRRTVGGSDGHSSGAARRPHPWSSCSRWRVGTAPPSW